MTTHRRTFQTSDSMEMMKKIIKFVCGRTGTTQKDVCEHTGLSDRAISEYMRYASNVLNQIHPTKRPCGIGKKGSLAMIWMGGPDPKTPDDVLLDAIEDTGKGGIRKVKIRTSWKHDAKPDPYALPPDFFARMAA